MKKKQHSVLAISLLLLGTSKLSAKAVVRKLNLTMGERRRIGQKLQLLSKQSLNVNLGARYGGTCL